MEGQRHRGALNKCAQEGTGKFCHILVVAAHDDEANSFERSGITKC